MPIEVKQQRGTYRSDRHQQSAQVTSRVNDRVAPKPPKHLSENARRFWDFAFRAPWVDPDIDYTLILMCAEDMDMRDLFCKRSAADPSNFRLQVAARDWTRLVISYLSLLGFTPTDRARLGFKASPGRTKLDDLIARASSQ